MNVSIPPDWGVIGSNTISKSSPQPLQVIERVTDPSPLQLDFLRWSSMPPQAGQAITGTGMIIVNLGVRCLAIGQPALVSVLRVAVASLNARNSRYRWIAARRNIDATIPPARS